MFSRNMLIVSKNLKLAFGIKRVTRTVCLFTVIQKQQTTKTINYNFLLVRVSRIIILNA